MVRRIFIAVWSALLTSNVLLAQPPQVNEYVPVTGPPTETVPAAPLLIGVYIIVWLGLMLYVWTIWRRLARVETEMQVLLRKSETAR